MTSMTSFPRCPSGYVSYKHVHPRIGQNSIVCYKAFRDVKINLVIKTGTSQHPGAHVLTMGSIHHLGTL